MNTEHTTSAPIKKKKLLVSFLDSEHKERFFNLVEANTDGAGDLTLMYGFSSNPALYNAFVQFSAVMKTNSKLNEFPLTIDDNLLTVENLMLITALEEISFNSGKASLIRQCVPSLRESESKKSLTQDHSRSFSRIVFGNLLKKRTKQGIIRTERFRRHEPLKRFSEEV